MNHDFGGRATVPAVARAARRKRSPRILVTAAMIVVTLAAGMGIERFFVDTSVSGSQRYEDLADLESFETLEQTYELIRQEYVLSDEISDEQLVHGASRGMMEALGDEDHSMFFDPEEAEEYYETRSGNYVGIGIRVDDTVSPPRVVEPLSGSPAFEAGILPGDDILAIDGVETADFADPADSVDLIAGEAGTNVVLELRGAGETEAREVTVTVTRARVDVETVTWAMLPDDVLWLRISAFQDGTGDDVVRALRSGQRLGAEGVILDLRNNSGGLIVEEVAVANQFLPEGSIITIRRDAEGNEFETQTEDRRGEWRDGPLVVLTNEKTVSAAEVTAAAIAENGRGVTVGTTTFGTGTSVRSFDLEDGSMVNMGIDLWLTPDGNVIWHQGLDPMIEVANEPDAPITVPILFDDNDVTLEQFSGLDDDQLLAGHHEVRGPVERASR